MAGYVGNVPVPQSVREDQSFTATAGQTTFNTLGYTDGNRIKVTLNGVLLEGGGVDYTATNGSDVVLTVAAVVDDIVRFETFNEVQLVSNTSTTPIIKTNLTLKNDTHEDTDGGRESTVIFSGEQSGGEITTLAEIEASHDGTADDQKGDLIFRTNDGNDGTSPTERLRINSSGDMLFSSEDPSLTLANTTHEDSDGGRESTIVFQGEQSGGEVSTLAQIEAAHDGTADDQKGDLIFRTNDGADGTSPTEVLRTNSAGNLLITSSDQNGLTLNTTDSNGGFIALKTSGTAKGYIGTSHHLVSGGSPSEDDITIRAEGKLQFAIGATEELRLDSDGLKFNGDTAAANALDDYEEGTWTPTLSGNAAYNIQYGTYVKVGTFVYVRFGIRPSSLGTGSVSRISGLPYTATAELQGLDIAYYDGAASNHYSIFGYVENSYIDLTMKTGSTNNSSSTTTFFQTNARIYASATYKTA